MFHISESSIRIRFCSCGDLCYKSRNVFGEVGMRKESEELEEQIM